MEINREREQMTLMKNYLCLFLVSGSISKWRLKKNAVLSGTTGHPSAPELSSNTRTCHCRESLKCQGASAALRLTTASLKTMKIFKRFYLSWWGFLGHQVHIPDCSYLWFCFWLRVPGISRHHKSPSVEALDVSYGLLNIICSSGDLNSIIALARDI